MRLYSSNMHDAPQLKNPTWGDFNKVFNYILDDSVDWTCTSVETIDDTLIKITYDTTTIKLIEGQSIVISDTANYNKEYVISDIATDGAICINLSITKGTLTEVGTFKFKRPACGLKRLFGGVSDQRTVVQFKSGCVMRVDDRPIGNLLTPNVTWLDTWHNFARVAIAESSDGLDNLKGKQMPYLPTQPTLNIMPSGKLIGNAIILYTIGQYNQTGLNVVVQNKATDNIEWTILADEKLIVISISRHINSTGYPTNRTYFFGDIFSTNPKFKYDQMLYTCRPSVNNNPAYDIAWNINTDTHTRFFLVNTAYNTSSIMDVDSTTSTDGVYSNGGIQCRQSYTSGTNNGYIYNNLILTDTYITNDRNLKAVIKDIKLISNNLSNNDNYTYGKVIKDIDGQLYKFMMCFYSDNAQTSANHVRYMVKINIPFK